MAAEPRVSVVVPVYDEEGNVAPLVEALTAALRPLGPPFELLLIDDGSSDGTLAAIRRLLPDVPELKAIALRRNFGQTLALQAGLDHARGDVVVTLDGDLQNDPRDIPLLLEKLEEGADVVSGWRRERQDTFLLRRLPSWLANGLIRRITGVPIRDQGCSLKAYRRSVLRELDLYGDMHRFIAVLTLPAGASIVEIPVRHHPRTSGTSKYGLSRIFKVITDLCVIQMLTWFRERPLRWFGLLGVPFLALSLAAAALPVLVGASTPVWASVSLIAAITFGSCMLVGLVGEAVLDALARGEGRRVLAREWPSRGGRE